MVAHFWGLNNVLFDPSNEFYNCYILHYRKSIWHYWTLMPWWESCKELSWNSLIVLSKIFKVSIYVYRPNPGFLQGVLKFQDLLEKSWNLKIVKKNSPGVLSHFEKVIKKSWNLVKIWKSSWKKSSITKYLLGFIKKKKKKKKKLIW